MDTAVRYTELMQTFTKVLKTTVTVGVDVFTGRRFDRVATDGSVSYFVDKQDWRIYGAKSGAQYNPRREYGTLETVTQFDWATGVAKPGTTLAQQLEQREATIASAYKKRGRPRKMPVVTP